MPSWLTHVLAFLGGVASGVVGNYLASRLTDRRREGESISRAKREFGKIRATMPELIAEMRQDFAHPEHKSVRELVLLPNRRVIFNTQQKRFAYYEEDHEDLRGKLTVLENHGHVSDVTPGNTPMYRVSEKFVELLRSPS